MKTSDIRRTNLALILESRFDGNKSALGRAVGRQAGYVAGMLPDGKSTRSFGEANARDFEQKLGLPRGWLDQPHESADRAIATAEESNSQAPTQVDLIPIDVWSDETPLGDDEVEIPFFKEVELAAGKGSDVMLETGGRKLRFGKRTLQRKGIPPEAAAAAVVTGNSMEPVLPDGSTVGVDTSNTQISDGKMYAINHEGQLRVKVLYRTPGNGLRLRSYNSDEHPDERYDGPYVAEHIRVIGKVFWYSVLI